MIGLVIEIIEVVCGIFVAETPADKRVLRTQNRLRMYSKISKALIETESCPERGQRIIRDLDLKGLGVRLTPHCKSYIVEGELTALKDGVH